MDTPKPHDPRPFVDHDASGIVTASKPVEKKRAFVPKPHLTQKPFEDLDLKMYGQASRNIKENIK
jgi:hypothetical protein